MNTNTWSDEPVYEDEILTDYDNYVMDTMMLEFSEIYVMEGNQGWGL